LNITILHEVADSGIAAGVNKRMKYLPMNYAASINHDALIKIATIAHILMLDVDANILTCQFVSGIQEAIDRRRFIHGCLISQGEINLNMFNGR
jgi:hypothetical protein